MFFWDMPKLSPIESHLEMLQSWGSSVVIMAYVIMMLLIKRSLPTCWQINILMFHGAKYWADASYGMFSYIYQNLVKSKVTSKCSNVITTTSYFLTYSTTILLLIETIPFYHQHVDIKINILIFHGCITNGQTDISCGIFSYVLFKGYPQCLNSP